MAAGGEETDRGAPPRTAAAPRAAVRPGWIHALWVAVFFGLAGALQTAMPYFQDGDTAYHLAVARLIERHGVLDAFPWTPFSWLADHYADKELLFHLLLVPVADWEPGLAAAVAGTVLGGLLLAVVYAVLVRERIPAAGAWTLLVPAISSAFVHRAALVRAHLLAIPLALVVTWSAARGRSWWLAAACFVFPLSYTAWHLPVVLVGVVEAVRLVTERRIEWRVPLAAGAGLAAGILAHPNFPANLELFWIQNYTVLFETVWGGKDGFAMGGEFRPFSPVSVVRYVVPAALAAGAALAFAWRRRRADAVPLALAVTAVAFLLVTLRTQRFIEYLAPFAVVALALAWRPPRPRRVVPGLVVAGAVWIALFARHPIGLLLDRMQTFPPEVAAALREIVPPGEQVVTCEWEITGEMMLALPERRFVVALDPVFFAMQDAERYRLWYDTVHAPPADAARRLRDGLDGRYVICDRRMKWLPLVRSLDRDPEAAWRGVHGYWVVFELLDEPAHASGSSEPGEAADASPVAPGAGRAGPRARS
jgi:hypothetical protein